MWHASVSCQIRGYPLGRLWAVAEDILSGVGDARLGEWRETGTLAVHLRRRLTLMEAIGIPVVDVRGTDEGWLRRAAIRPFLPPQFAHVPDEQLV